MRIFAPPVAFSVALILGLSGGAAFAQDQPAAGSPPPATATQAPSDAQAGSPDTPPPPPDAQAAPANRAPNPERQAKMLARRLSLSPDQESQIEPILAQRDQQVQTARADASLTPRDIRVKVRGIQQDSDSKIEAILNDGQRQQYEQLKAEQRAKRQQQREQQQGGVPPPPADNQ